MAQPGDFANPLIEEITLRNILSFGPDTPPLKLGPLNILVGPNGSGKSNLIDAIGLLRATPGDMAKAISDSGGVTEWAWKGAPDRPARVGAVVANPLGSKPLSHTIAFVARNQQLMLSDERIEAGRPGRHHAKPYLYYGARDGRIFIKAIGVERELALDALVADRSILAQRRDPDAYPELTYLADAYESIRVYREWSFGRDTVFRRYQPADMRSEWLDERCNNLGLFLNRLRENPTAKRAVLDALRDLYEGLDDYDVSVKGGAVQVYFTEGDFTIPATRLSDGTLRYLALVAILCDPTPPPLICIEEPELGLHPDIVVKLADLLKAASERTQLIVTTHSDILVDAMSTRPEAIIVCEKHNGQTTMQRLDPAEMEVWLEKYGLGDLWRSGQLGGNRW